MRLISMTLCASALILTGAAARLIFRRRVPASVMRMLWLAAALRMLVPFSADVAIGEPEIRYIYMTQSGQTAAEDSIPREHTAEGAKASESSGITAQDVLLCIWLGGMALSAAYFTAGHLRFRRAYSTAVPTESGHVREMIASAQIRRKTAVKICENISSPVTMGIFRPVILLPKGIDMTAHGTEMMIAHELVHIKRFDAAYKVIIAAAACVHWFNPLAWLMYSLAVRDMEISCDNEAIGTGKYAPADYARMLIMMEERRISPFVGGFGAKPVKERIERIMKFRKSKAVTAIAVFAVLIAAAAVFIRPEKPDPEIVYVPAQAFDPVYIEPELPQVVYVPEEDEEKLRLEEMPMRIEEEQHRLEEEQRLLEQERIRLEAVNAELEADIRRREEELRRLEEQAKAEAAVNTPDF